MAAVRTAETIFVGDAESIVRAALEADRGVDSSAKGIATSNDLIAKSYGEALAAAQETADKVVANAARMGASMEEQSKLAEDAAKASMGSYGEMEHAAQAAGEAAAKASAVIGGSLNDQRVAYAKAADAAKVASDEEIKAADEAAAAQVAASKKAAEAAEAAAGKQVEKANAVGAAMSSIGSKTLLGAGLVAAGTTVMASDFQSKMTRLETQAKLTEGQVGKLQAGILNMHVGTGPNELAEGMYHVASSLNATLPPMERDKRELEALEIAAKGAQVGHADLVDTTNALDAAIVSGMHGLGNYSEAMGTLNAIVGSGDMKMQDLADALGTGLLAPMKNYGVSIQDVGGALAVFGDNNLRGADAATKLRSAIRIMAAPSKAAGDELESMGIKATQLGEDIRSHGLSYALEDLEAHLKATGKDATEQMRIVAKAFGGRQSEGVQILIGQLDRLKAKTKEVSDGTKSFGGDWQKRTENLAYQTKELEAESEKLADKVGLALIPKLEELAGTTEEVVTWFEKNKAEADILGAAITVVLGGAIGAFVAGRVAAFIKGIQAMISMSVVLGEKMLTTAGIMGTAEAEMVTETEAAAVEIDAALVGTGIGATLVALGVLGVELGTHWSEAMHTLESAAESAANFVIDRLNEIIHGINELTSKLTFGLAPAIGEIGKFASESSSGATKISSENYGHLKTGEPSLTGLNKGSVEASVVAGLMSAGLSSSAANGVMKILGAESAFDPKNEEKPGSKHGGYGLAQWTEGRREGLEKFAGEHHVSGNAVSTQIAYLVKELKEGTGGVNIGQLNHAGSTKAVEQMFVDLFERPLKSNIPAILERAGQYNAQGVSAAPIGAAAEKAEKEAKKKAELNPAEITKWAESSVGHFAESWGKNTGPELNKLQSEFHTQAAAWCAEFATTAAMMGGASKQVRTASVAMIREWAEHGSHGYHKGLSNDPKVGSLMLFGNEHVGFVDAINKALGTVTTIEGNTNVGNGAVRKVTHKIGEGEYADPIYKGTSGGTGTNAYQEAAKKALETIQKSGEAERTRLTTAIQTGSAKSLESALNHTHEVALGKVETMLTMTHTGALTKLDKELVETHAQALHALDVAIVREWNSAVAELSKKIEDAVEKATDAWQRAQEKATTDKYNAGLETIEKGPNATGIKSDEKAEYTERQKREEKELEKRLKEAHWTGNKEEVEKAEEAIRQFRRQQDVHTMKEKEEQETKALDDGKTAEEKSLEERVNAYKGALNEQLVALQKQLTEGRISVEAFINDVDAALAKAGPGITISISPKLASTITSGSSGNEGPVIVSEHSQPVSHASGGRTYPGVTYEVGETGREMFTPDTAGTITPASQNAGAAAMNNHFYGPITMGSKRDADRFAHKLAHKLRFGGR